VCRRGAVTTLQAARTLTTKNLTRLGVPVGEPIEFAQEFIQNFVTQANDGAQLDAQIFDIVANPPAFFANELRAPLSIRTVFAIAF
jgi:tRNA-splicing ligase RtcB (3'-phosphate/5'-hydroxy nucleic acid ligase)